MRDTTRELRLAAALVEAADTLTDGFDTAHYLQRVCDHCAELLEARAAGIMLIDGGGAVSLAGSSRRQEVAVDLLRAQHGGGPCLESYGTGRPVAPLSVRAAHADARWPDFTAAALDHDIAVTFAVPLRRRGTPLGALNVFGSVAADGDKHLPVAQCLADAAAVGVQNQRTYAQYRALSSQLQAALSGRGLIERAKGMLAERWGTSADTVFAALRRYARRRRLPLDDVARAVTEGRLDDSELRDPP
ncbi:ANTAR domain-containing protein [Streptomyces sp. NPDC059582]|uniref:ANTAR domain-containing protein n=1 Tax=Streptomyces sp. NPDC059582 TaxID=3346875 RepID=UPI0036A6EBC1